MPCHHIQRRMVHGGPPKPAREFGDELASDVEVLVARVRRLEITWIGESIGTDGSKFRKLERGAEIFADITAYGARGMIHPESHAARNHRNFLRFDAQAPEFRI